MTTEVQITAFITQLLREKNNHVSLTNQTSLVTSGLLDSVDVVNVVVFIEETFRINLADDGFDPTDFDTVQKINEFVQKKI